MTGRCVHIIGAGLAGLSCATHVKSLGGTPVVYEASSLAGGRVRPVSGPFEHDNGTHLIVGAYHYLFEYVDQIGTRDQLLPLTPSDFKMEMGKAQWTISSNTFFRDLIFGDIPEVGLFNLFSETGYDRLLDPLCLAVFNTPARRVSKRLLLSTLWTLIKSGPEAMRPYFVKQTLSDALIAPALDGVEVHYGWRLVSLDKTQLVFRNNKVSVNPNESVVLALPFQAYKSVDCPFPTPQFQASAIANIHFYLEQEVEPLFVGLVGTLSQWVYAKRRHVCVTISHYQPQDDLVETVWSEIAHLFGMDKTSIPQHRVINEKFATPFQDASFQKQRLKVTTTEPHIFLAGDCVQNGLPATLEGAVKSGKAAAYLAMGKN